MQENYISQNDRYIIDESNVISSATFPFGNKLLKAFPAFGHKNYRFYFAGQLVSLIGTWLQMVAQGWLVFQLTHSAFWVGAVAALGSLPILFFPLFGGVIIDRLPKKNILIFTQFVAMVLAFILGFLVVLGTADLFSICILSFLLGAVTALDLPTRQAFAVEMVGKDSLTSAIALNSATFNSARVIGPGVAGIIIALIGVGGAFILNGLSYIAVLLALFFIKVQPHISRTHTHPLHALKEGVGYTFHHPLIRNLLLLTAVTSIFGWSYATILPVIAEKSFHLSASGLGYLYSVSGMGAVFTTILISVYSRKVSPFVFIIGGDMLFVLAIMVFTFSSNAIIGGVFLFFAGAGLIAQFATINSLIQHTVADELRGRVASLYILMFLGMQPLGNFQVGILSEYYGTAFALRLGATIVFLFGLYFLFSQKEKSLLY